MNAGGGVLVRERDDWRARAERYEKVLFEIAETCTGRSLRLASKVLQDEGRLAGPDAGTTDGTT